MPVNIKINRYTGKRELDLLKLDENEILDNLLNIKEPNTIRLDKNIFDRLPQNIDNLKSVEKLVLHGFNKIPKELFRFPKINELYIFFEPKLRYETEKDFDVLENLKELKRLTISNGRVDEHLAYIIINKLPNGIERLNFNHNRLKEIPKNIIRLKNLTHLSLSNNEVRYFEPELLKCQKLISLALYENKISIIPREMLEIPSLQILKNPIEFPKIENERPNKQAFKEFYLKLEQDKKYSISQKKLQNALISSILDNQRVYEKIEVQLNTLNQKIEKNNIKSIEEKLNMINVLNQKMLKELKQSKEELVNVSVQVLGLLNVDLNNIVRKFRKK